MSAETPCQSDDPCLEPVGCAGNCLFKARDCSDGDPCTLDACEPDEGCVHFEYDPCDDGNTMTEDLCIHNVGCQFEVQGEPICELSGAQGDELVCPIELVKPDDGDSPLPTPFPSSLQGDLHWDNQHLEFLGFEDDFVLPTGDVVTVPLPPNPLSTGHSFVVNPTNLAGAQQVGTVLILIVHLQLPWTELNDAIISDDGQTVQGNPEIFRARFRLLAGASEEEPALVRLSGVVGSGPDTNSLAYYVDGLRITQERHCNSHADCDDDDPCTHDVCAIPGVQYCGHDDVIPSDVGIVADPCIIYTCNPSTGEFDTAPRLCDDGDACTDDVCTGETSCEFFLIDPDDGDACTADFCDPTEGVFHKPADCFDHDPCTTDKCVPGLGCVNTPWACEDGFSCTNDVCIKGECTPVADHDQCDDGDPTTQDYCAPELPESDPTSGCLHTAE